MPERFFDPEFIQRVVRILQLKGGRAPAEVADEIVPVLDLTPLLLRAPVDLPGDLLPEFPSLSTLGLLFAVHAPHFPAPAAGTVKVAQVFNPVGSGRRVVIAGLMWWSSSIRAGRFHNTALANQIDVAFIPPKRTIQGGVSLTEIREEDFLIANVPATTEISHYDERGTSNDLIQATTPSAPVTLDPGQGFQYYPTFQSLTDAGPTPRDAVGYSVNICLIELPL